MSTFFYIQSAWLTITGIGLCFVHIFFALAVLSDAVAIQDKGQKMVFVSGKMWALATLFGSFLVLLAYWIIHHSTLRSSSDSFLPTTDEENASARTDSRPKTELPY